jgi:membrane protein DedA with SNARE-associated domain
LEKTVEHLTLLVERHGLLLVWGNVFLAQAGVPLPVAPTLLVAGAFAGRDAFSWPALLAGAVVASLIADYLWYLAGVRFGERVLASLYRAFAVPEGRARRIEAAVSRWGMPALIIAKFIPGLALVAPPIAGMAHMRPVAFLAAAGTGGALWAGVPIAMGAYHQQAIQQALAAMSAQADWIAIVAGVLLLAFVGHIWWKHHGLRGAA